MDWINPPQFVRRFSLQQILQHGVAIVISVMLLSSGLFMKGWGGLHAALGLGAAALLAIHLFSLLVIGVRHDVSVEQIAFLPVGGERDADGNPVDGKYTMAERRDYFLILAWSFGVALTGVGLRFPASFGIPDPQAYAWLRILHVAISTAWFLHLFSCHVPARFISAPGGLRFSIFTGKVPLESVESRPGWVASLVEKGVLVPVPVEEKAESERESMQVRAMLDEANRLTREARFEDAAAIFEEALRLYPEYSQARFNLAVARMKQGRPDMAAEQFRIFLEVDPFNPMAGKARDLLDGIGKVSEGGDL